MKNAPVIPDVVMLDRVLGELQKKLVELPWLDVAFGRAQRLVKIVNGKRIISPNVYCGGWNGHGKNDYIEVSPDAHIGNFSFFTIDDPQTLDGGPWARTITTPFGLVFWMDLRKVFGSDTARNTEMLKAQVFDLLGKVAIGGAYIRLNRTYEIAENIYKGYNISEVDNQYLMHPYWGFRLDGELKYDEFCFNELPPPVETFRLMCKGGEIFKTSDNKNFIVKH